MQSAKPAEQSLPCSSRALVTRLRPHSASVARFEAVQLCSRSPFIAAIQGLYMAHCCLASSKPLQSDSWVSEEGRGRWTLMQVASVQSETGSQRQDPRCASSSRCRPPRPVLHCSQPLCCVASSHTLVLCHQLGAITRPVNCTTACLLYTSPSPRDGLLSRMPSSA